MEVGGRGLIPRITRRCLTDDLDLPADSVDLPIDELANAGDVIAAFRDRRAEMGAAGQEPIRSLLPEVVAFSLHVRRRGATWHHREAGVIWLLATTVKDTRTMHTRTSSDSKLRAGLLPDRDDMLALVRSQAPTLARSLPRPPRDSPPRFIFTPGGFEDLIREMSEPAGSRTLPPPPEEEPDMERIKAIAEAHGAELLV